jgi:hypothetical protein
MFYFKRFGKAFSTFLKYGVTNCHLNTTALVVLQYNTASFVFHLETKRNPKISEELDWQNPSRIRYSCNFNLATQHHIVTICIIDTH